jgi:hypothetical protein
MKIKNIQCSLKNQNGSALAYVLGFMLLATILGVMLYKYTGLAQIMSARELQRTSAQAAVNAGTTAVQSWIADKPDTAILVFQTMINNKIASPTTVPSPILLAVKQMDEGKGKQSYTAYLTDFIYTSIPMVAQVQVVGIGQNGSRHIQTFSYEVMGLKLADTPPVSATIIKGMPTDALYMAGGMESMIDNVVIDGDMTTPTLVATGGGSLHVKGNLILEGTQKEILSGHGVNTIDNKVVVDKDALFTAPVRFFSKADVTILGNAEFKRPPEFSAKLPNVIKLNVAGDLLYTNFVMTGDVGAVYPEIKVTGNLKQSSTNSGAFYNVLEVGGDARFNGSQTFGADVKVKMFGKTNVNGALNIPSLSGSAFWKYWGNVSTNEVVSACDSANASAQTSSNYRCSLGKSTWTLNARDTLLQEVDDNMSYNLFSTLDLDGEDNDLSTVVDNELKPEDLSLDYTKITNSLDQGASPYTVADLNNAYRTFKNSNRLIGGSSGYLAVKLSPQWIIDNSSDELIGKFIFIFDGKGTQTAFNINPNDTKTWFPNMSPSSIALIWIRNAAVVSDFTAKGTCHCFFFAENGDHRFGFNSAFKDQLIDGAVYIKQPVTGTLAYRVGFGSTYSPYVNSGSTDILRIKYNSNVLLDIFANTGISNLVVTKSTDYAFTATEKTRLVRMAEKLVVKLVNTESGTADVSGGTVLGQNDIVPYLDIFPLKGSITLGETFDFTKVTTESRVVGSATCNSVTNNAATKYDKTGVFPITYTLRCGSKAVSRVFLLAVNSPSMSLAAVSTIGISSSSSSFSSSSAVTQSSNSACPEWVENTSYTASQCVTYISKSYKCQAGQEGWCKTSYPTQHNGVWILQP